MLHSPCREDRANAAISWMVRALLDFGNISMVSSTFTWNDKKKKRESGENRYSSSALHEREPASEHILLWFTRKPQCCLFMETGLLRTSTTSVYFKASGSERFCLFTPINAFNESQAVCRQSHTRMHVCACSMFYLVCFIWKKKKKVDKPQVVAYRGLCARLFLSRAQWLPGVLLSTSGDNN